jgi:iron complex transport system permease protein
VSRRISTFAALLLLLAGTALLAVWLGDQPLSLKTAWSEPDSLDGALLWRLRLPRAALAALVGAALGASGAALQVLLRNPLADPFVLGVSGGAALGATVASALGLGAAATVAGVGGVSLAAFGGAVAATAVVFLAGRAAGGTAPHGVLLAGTIFNAFALAAITFVRSLAAPGQGGELLHWLAGSLGYEAPAALGLLALAQGVGLGGLGVLSGRLNVLSLGDDEAASLGVPVERTRLWVLLCASLSVGAAVALSGLIGFVGLLVPQVLRPVLGADARRLVPASALGGAVLLLGADTAARLLFPVFQSEPPVGALTALLGGPFFLLSLRRGAAAA